MNDGNPQQEGDNDPTRYLTQLEQTNRALDQQVADCTDQLSQVQTSLSEAQQALMQNRQLELERLNLLARERELYELKSNFVTLASHEFRTPMMTILSSASLIGRYNGAEDGDKRERHVQRIKSAVTSLTDMLADFLSVSQIDQNTLINQPEPLDLILFCEQVLTQAKALAKPRQRVTYTHAGDVSTVSLDGQLLKTILLNLLTNASRYSADDTDIRLASTIHDNQLTLTVSDQGIGIQDTDKEKLFINFFRGRNAIHIQGTGLGLYLVKRYVDLLSGSITFTSQMGQGTVFTVQLPLSDRLV